MEAGEKHLGTGTGRQTVAEGSDPPFENDVVRDAGAVNGKALSVSEFEKPDTIDECSTSSLRGSSTPSGVGDLARVTGHSDGSGTSAVIVLGACALSAA